MTHAPTAFSPAWVALCLVEHLGAKKLRALLRHFDGDADAILRADDADLRCVPGIGVKISAAIQRIDLAALEQSLRRWEAADVRLIRASDEDYPALLCHVEDAPPLLFARGDAVSTIAAGRCAAIVGTRQPSPEALLVAKRIGYGLAGAGWTIVSGMALGIDTGGHLGALAANGVTHAVLGGGVLDPYPPQNRTLAQAIMARGLLVSEVDPDARPTRSHLVARNRIISGMCEALIVVETGSDGGAMHAARRALEQGRRVFTLDLQAGGNQMLAGEGATLLPDADALVAAVAALSAYRPPSPTPPQPIQLPLVE